MTLTSLGPGSWCEQRFFGLKRLQLHASINDPTLMRERLSYSLFREFGVPTVRQTYCTVKRVGAEGDEGDHLGVHILTEVLDGRWTRAHPSGSHDTTRCDRRTVL